MSTEAFQIMHPNIKLEIRLEELEKLHIHEEVIPDILRKLTEDIKADGHFKHPVIVDSKTLVVRSASSGCRSKTRLPLHTSLSR